MATQSPVSGEAIIIGWGCLFFYFLLVRPLIFLFMDGRNQRVKSDRSYNYN